MKTKRQIGRKIISFLTTVAMVVGMMAGMTITAEAEEMPMLVVAGNPVDISTDIAGTGWSYDKNGNTLTLEGFNYDGSAGNAQDGKNFTGSMPIILMD